MGLLDEILKQLEEAQQQGRPAPQPRTQRAPRPERESDEDGAEWDEDEAARPGHAPHIPSRRVEPVAAAPEPPAVRTTMDTRPALAPHEQGVATAVRMRAMLASRGAIRDALIMREILGPPPGLRRLRR